MNARAELLRGLAAISEGPCRPELAAGLSLGTPPAPARFTEVFLLLTHPYASVHLGAEGMLGGEAADRVAGFWRTIGVVPPNPPDHLAILLAGYAGLREEAAALGPGPRGVAATRAASVLLWEHLLSWVPGYLESVRSLAEPFFSGWAALVLETLLDEASSCGGEPLPAALRLAPDPVSASDGRRDLVTGLLAPIRSGVVVTRADLGRACLELGLGLRQGERAYLLEAMLDQDARSSLGWLAAHARTWASRHHGLRGTTLERVGGWWEDRARRTSEVLEELLARPAPAAGR